MTGGEARLLSERALQSLASVWGKSDRTYSDAFGKANWDIVKGAIDQLRGVVNRIPDGTLPPKAPGNITWDLHNALVRVDAANSTLSTYGMVPNKTSFAKELTSQIALWVTEPGEALNRAKESLSDLAHGRGAFDWLPDFSKALPWFGGGLAIVGVVIVVALFLRVRGR